MVSDDRVEQGDRDRERFLEEIRRRAEEAELRRIDEDEQSLDSVEKDVPPLPPQKPVPPPPSGTPPHALQDEHLAIVCERILTALDRGNLEQATSLLLLAQSVAPSDPRLAEYSLRLDTLRARQSESRPAVAPPQKPPTPTISKKKLTEMFKRAESAYQHENYDEALGGTEEILSLDPENEAALRLREDIFRSRELSELIKKEEALHRAREEQELVRAPAPTVPPPPQADEKIWGQTEIAPVDADGLEVAETAPEKPRKPSVVLQLMRRLATIRVPVKPLMIGAGVLAAAVAGYLVIHQLLNVVVPPQNILLITAPNVPPGDDRARLFADGISEELIRMVGRAEDVWVINPFSAFLGVSGRKSEREFSGMFGARFVLTSTMQLKGDSLYWQATMFDSVKGVDTWSLEERLPIRKVYSQIGAVVPQILRAMGIDAGVAHAPSPRRLQDVPDSVLEAYFAGRAELRSGDPKAVARAEQWFRQAILMDSLFANAHSALAWTIVQNAEWDSVATNRELAVAIEHTQLSLRLADRSPEDFRTLGLVELYRGNLEKALEFLQQAASLNRSDAETQRRLAGLYIRSGMTEEAAVAAEAANAFDSHNPLSHFYVGVVRYLRGEFTEALPHIAALFSSGQDRVISGGDLYPDLLISLNRPEDALSIAIDRTAQSPGDPEVHYRRARISQVAGHQKDEWSASLLRAESLLSDSIAAVGNSPPLNAWLALVYTRLGEFKAAREASQRALELGPKNVDVLYMTARMYALQREKEKAFSFLQKAKNERFRLDYLVDLDLFNLRSDPAFLGPETR